MNVITKDDLDSILDSIVLDIKNPEFDTREKVIRYFIMTYGNLGYIPYFFYILFSITVVGVLFLVYIAINGGMSHDQANLYEGFFRLWITGSNILYFLSIILFLSYFYARFIKKVLPFFSFKWLLLLLTSIPATWYIGIFISYIFR